MHAFWWSLTLLLMAVGLLNTGLFSMGDRDRRLDAISKGWAMGRRARAFFGTQWDELWSRPIGDVRASLHVEPFAEPLAAAA